MSIKEALLVALESDVDNDVFAEELEVLEEQASGVTPQDVLVEVASVESDLTILKHLRSALESRVANDQDRALFQAVTHRYAGDGVGLESNGDLAAVVTGWIAGLEAAAGVALESWSVKDLWDAVGAVERNSRELSGHIATIRDNEKWFDDHAFAMTGIGGLTYLTVDNQPVKDFRKAVADSDKVASGMLKASEEALSQSAKMLKDLQSAKVSDDKSAEAILKRLSGYANPGKKHATEFSKPLLANRTVKSTPRPLSFKTDAVAPQWKEAYSFEVEQMGKRVGGGMESTRRMSPWIKVPLWLVTAAAMYFTGGLVVGSAAALLAGYAGVVTTLQGMLAVTFVTDVTVSILVSNSVVRSIERAYGKDVSYEDIGLEAAAGAPKVAGNILTKDLIAAMSAVVSSANQSANQRRQYPKRWAAHESLKAQLSQLRSDAMKTGVTSNGLNHLDDAIRIVTECDRVGWDLAHAGFELNKVLVTGMEKLGRSIVKTIGK